MGYYQTFKINTEQFVDVKYNVDTWYQLDILLDWYDSQIAFFIDGKYRTMTKFYSFMRDEHLKGQCEDSQRVDTLSLYTLSPGVTSTFRQLRVCSQLCPTLEDQESVIRLYKGDEPTEFLEEPLTIFGENRSNFAYKVPLLDIFALLAVVLCLILI